MLVIEGMSGLLIFCRPDNRLGGVREVSAREIRRRIRFDPGYVVQEFKIQLLHGKTDRVDDVGGATDPDRAVWF